MRDGKNYFHWAIVEYGEENFKWEILDRSDNQNRLNELEKFFIKILEPMIIDLVIMEPKVVKVK